MLRGVVFGLVALMATSAFAQTREFEHRQVWVLPAPFEPGEVEILCLYEDGASAAVFIRGIPAPEDLPFDTFNSPAVRITLAALHASGLRYHHWFGSLHGGDPPRMDCATPEMQALPAYDKPIAEVLLDVAARVRAQQAAAQ